MLIEQHRTLSGLNVFLVIVVGIALCLGVYLHLPDSLTPVFFEPGLDRLVDLQLGIKFSPSFNVLLTLVLSLIHAFYLNQLDNHYNLMGKPNFLTTVTIITLVNTYFHYLVLY